MSIPAVVKLETFLHKHLKQKGKDLEFVLNW